MDFAVTRTFTNLVFILACRVCFYRTGKSYFLLQNYQLKKFPYPNFFLLVCIVFRNNICSKIQVLAWQFIFGFKYFSISILVTIIHLSQMAFTRGLLVMTTYTQTRCHLSGKGIKKFCWISDHDLTSVCLDPTPPLFLAKHQNCHFWELKEELKRTEKNLKELKLSK